MTKCRKIRIPAIVAVVLALSAFAAWWLFRDDNNPLCTTYKDPMAQQYLWIESLDAPKRESLIAVSFLPDFGYVRTDDPSGTCAILLAEWIIRDGRPVFDEDAIKSVRESIKGNKPVRRFEALAFVKNNRSATAILQQMSKKQLVRWIKKDSVEVFKELEKQAEQEDKARASSGPADRDKKVEEGR